MSHWAEIDSNNRVLRVVVGDDSLPDEGESVVKALGGTWVKTSYNTRKGVHILGGTPFRKNYAGINFIYDQVKDAFYEPQPYASWVLNEDTCSWEPPVRYPADGKSYTWNEDLRAWEEQEEEVY